METLGQSGLETAFCTLDTQDPAMLKQILSSRCVVPVAEIDRTDCASVQQEMNMCRRDEIPSGRHRTVREPLYFVDTSSADPAKAAGPALAKKPYKYHHERSKPMNTNWNDPNFQGFGGKNPFGGRPKKAKAPRKAVGTPLGRTLLNLAVTLLVGAVYYYAELPALNLHSGTLYVFVILLCAVYCGMAVLTSGFQGSGAKGYFGFVKKQCKIPLILTLALLVTAIVGSIVGWKLLRAGSYRDLLTVESGDFASEVQEISFDQIPMLDRDSASKLGNRKLGELADMVSQFEVDDDYTQINYKGRPVRVTALRYGDWSSG